MHLLVESHIIEMHGTGVKITKLISFVLLVDMCPKHLASSTEVTLFLSLKTSPKFVLFPFFAF